jgi:hypothetical protein
MKLDEIRDGLDDSHPSEFEYDKIAYWRLMEKIDKAIAERALPPSIERIENAAGGFSHDGGVFIVGMKGEWDVFRKFGQTSVHITTVKTMGQLLDLLSGLGVRK